MYYRNVGRGEMVNMCNMVLVGFVGYFFNFCKVLSEKSLEGFRSEWYSKTGVLT